jgi:uncharacterized iron-regulated membrane protein
MYYICVSYVRPSNSALRTLRACHKYLGLALGALWALEALSGTLLVFHRELSDAELNSKPVATDFRRLDARMTAIERTAGAFRIDQLSVSGGLSGFFDLQEIDDAGRIRVLKLDGQGDVLASHPYNYDFRRMTVLQLAYLFHTSLFAGPTGRLLLGASGCLLMVTLILALRLAWPPRRQLRRWLWPAAQRRPALKWLTWHRAVGLWLVFPSLLFITAGAVEGMIVPLERLVAMPPPPHVAPTTRSPSRISPSRAIAAAVARNPGSRFATLQMPTARETWYQIRVREPGELRRVFGTTTVYVSATDGSVLADQDALKAPFGVRVLANCFPLHTGEFMGLGGRLLSLVNGLWLTVMIMLGVTLWWSRRIQRPPRSDNSR